MLFIVFVLYAATGMEVMANMSEGMTEEIGRWIDEDVLETKGDIVFLLFRIILNAAFLLFWPIVFAVAYVRVKD